VGDGDVLAAKFDRAVGDGGLDLAVGSRGDRDDVGELKVGRFERQQEIRKATIELSRAQRR
jgi:hypothetical protein